MTSPELTHEVTADVVVVGAGFAGLMAATGLQQRGHRVVVVEALDRVGGKSDSAHDALGRRVDTGGQFVCDDMPNVLALIRHQGKRLVPVDHDTPGRAFVGGDRRTADPQTLWHTFHTAEQTIEQMAGLEVGFDDPTISMGQRLASVELADDVLAAARAALNGIMCVAVDDLPAAHVIDLARRTPLTRDELQYVVAETMHAVAERLADDLVNGLLLNEPARSIEVTSQHSVAVRTDRRTVIAKHVVVAVPPTAYATMSFTPPLPSAVLHAAGGFRAGSVTKFLVRYDQPFWRDQQVGSTSMWLDPSGLYVGDASPDEDTSILVAFLGGPSSHTWRAMSADERRRLLLLRLVEAYGPQAGSPISFVERDWTPDDWGGGGYWNVLLDGSITDAVDVLLRGAPGVTFASTELAASFPGYIEGAINAGRAAAASVSELLIPHRSVPA